MIDESYRLVFEGLPKEIRSEITLKSGENYEYEISFGRKKYWFTHKTTNPQGFDNLED